MDLATPGVFLNCLSSTGAKCIIHILSDNFEVLTEHELENALLCHYSMYASRDLTDPIEIIEIAFTRITSRYHVIENGKIISSRSAGYDITQAKIL